MYENVNDWQNMDYNMSELAGVLFSVGWRLDELDEIIDQFNLENEEEIERFEYHMEKEMNYLMETCDEVAETLHSWGYSHTDTEEIEEQVGSKSSFVNAEENLVEIVANKMKELENNEE